MKSARSTRSRDKAFLMQLAEMMEASGSKQMKMLQLADPEPELMPYSEWEKKHHVELNRLPVIYHSKIRDRNHEQILQAGDQIMQSIASSASTSRNSGSRSRSNFSEFPDDENDVNAQEQRMYEELKLANTKLREQYEQEMAELKKEMEKRLKQVATAKDIMCEEKLNDLRAALTKEHQREMAKLEDEVTRNVTLRCRNEDKTALRKQLAEELQLQHAKDLQHALADERNKFEKLLRQRMSQQERVFDEKLDATITQLNNKHDQQYNALVKLFVVLYERHAELLVRNEEVETDFRQLQTDYQRFMNYTEGMFHSDFMMKLRTHGLDLSRKKTEIYSKDYLHEIQSFYQKVSRTSS